MHAQQDAHELIKHIFSVFDAVCDELRRTCQSDHEANDNTNISSTNDEMNFSKDMVNSDNLESMSTKTEVNSEHTTISIGNIVSPGSLFTFVIEHTTKCDECETSSSRSENVDEVRDIGRKFSISPLFSLHSYSCFIRILDRDMHTSDELAVWYSIDTGEYSADWREQVHV